MGFVSACAFSFMCKYLHQSCGPKPMTRVDINDNNQSSNRKLCSWPLVDHGFQEYNALEGHHVKGQNSVMDFKRSSLDGRRMLWKEHISRTATRIRRSGFDIPIEEINMSTTRSKSSSSAV
jgi:hypothetical protein